MNDKVYKDIRVFRFKNDIVVNKDVEGRSAGPVPIFDDSGKIIGFAIIRTESGVVFAECAIDPSTPERLDLETGNRSYWIDAALEYRGFHATSKGFIPTIVYVHALRLTTTENEHLPVYGGSLE